jgi:hypothetical protein
MTKDRLFFKVEFLHVQTSSISKERIVEFNTAAISFIIAKKKKVPHRPPAACRLFKRQLISGNGAR